VNLAIANALRGERVPVARIAESLEAAGVGPNTLHAVREVPGRSLEGLNLDRTAIGFTLKAMQAGLWSLEYSADFESSLIAVVQAGGDTDTNGAVAGAILGALHGAGSIPDRWVARVAKAEHLASLADRLLERAMERAEI
jgi:ADP-ribosylglycohydrolase